MVRLLWVAPGAPGLGAAARLGANNKEKHSLSEGNCIQIQKTPQKDSGLIIRGREWERIRAKRLQDGPEV